MLENILILKNIGIKKRALYKSIVSASLIALAVLLPQIVHLALGQPGGAKWLPMYLPVLIGGCLLGSRWALAVGVLSPAVSFALTSLISNPMPTAERLPFMIAELGVFALVSGLFTKKISENAAWALPAVISAQLAGRLSFLGLSALFSSFVSFTPVMIWEQIKAGALALALQAVFVPLIIVLLKKVLTKGEKND